MSNRPKSLTSVFSNRTGSSKKRPTHNNGYGYKTTSPNRQASTNIPRLSMQRDQMQRSTYVPNITQVDIHRDYNTYQNTSQNNQNIPNNYHPQPAIINDQLQQYHNTIPRPVTGVQTYQYNKLATIPQHEPLMSPHIILAHPDVSILKKEVEQLKVILTQKDEKINDLEAEMKIVKDQNIQFQKIYKHLQNFDESQSSKGRFAISKLFLQMKLMKRPSKDDLKKKKILQNELVFDNELDRIPQHEFIKYIPKIVVECVIALESNLFIKTNSLYRVSGNYATIQKLRYDIDNNKYNKLHDQKDPHNISNILKLFLRELKTPLISYSQLQAGIPSLNSFDNDMIDAKICKIKKLYHSLPLVNRETLKYLIKHLEKVADIRENNMTSEHLAIIFGACIFNDITSTINSKDDMDLFLNSTAIPNLCIRIMIENYEEIFEKKYLGMDDENADDDNVDSDDDNNGYKNYDEDQYDEKYGTLV